jgi:hypothetical protein
MPEPGLLNGQPIGPELPPPVLCEVCGADVWTTEGATASRDHRQDGEPATVTMRGVFERDRLLEVMRGHAWALSPHRCKGGRSYVRVDGRTVDDDAAG